MGKVDGNEKGQVDRLSKIEEGTPQFHLVLANPKYASFIYSTKASVVIVNHDFVPEQPVSATLVKE